MAKLGSQFAKHFVTNEVLVPHLNNWFGNTENFPEEIRFSIKPHKEADDAFHPSSALMCHRALLAKMEGLLPPEMARIDSQKTFMVGHYYHALIQYIVVEGLGFSTWDNIEKEFDLYFETPNGNPYRVRGFPDISRMSVPDGREFLVDIKTMMARIYAQPNLPEGLLEKYRAQVQLYMEFEDIDNAIILAVEKDTPHRFKEIEVERDGSFVDEILEGWELVVDSRAEGIIPDCTCFDPDKCPAKNIYASDDKITI